jgi:hypothetical protein
VKVVSPTAAFDAGRELARRLIAALRDPAFLPVIYPALYGDGVDEGSLHAYMLSGLVLIGDHLGYSPVCDSPIFDRLDKLLTSEGAKRPDAIWFTRGTQTVRCLLEFERYTRFSLVSKAKNLLVMGKELQGDLHLAVLDYWTYTPLSDMDLVDVRRIFESGFRHSSGVAFPPLTCATAIIETLVTHQGGKSHIIGVLPRVFAIGGETKTYVVNELRGAIESSSLE